MHYNQHEIYHIYNRGNQKQKIFFNPGNYEYFVRKMKKHLVPCCDILAWCLMPNHFHLLIHANQYSVELANRRGFPYQNLSEAIRMLLSSYTKGINSKMNMTGNLFQQKTQARPMISSSGNYSEIAFNYIHQNPFKAGLSPKIDHWKYSSFRDYIGKRKSGICNIDLARELLNLGTPSDIYQNTIHYQTSDASVIFNPDKKTDTNRIPVIDFQKI